MFVKEIHRFQNEPYKKFGKLYWNLNEIINEIENEIKKIIENGFDIINIALDSWGVDYVWLNKNGEILEDPICYRNNCNNWKELDDKISKFEIFKETGINFFDFNSIYRIHKDKYKKRETLLFLPNLIGYFFTKVKNTEYSMATTSGLVNQTKKSIQNKYKKIFLC